MNEIVGLFPGIGGIDGIGRSGLAAWQGLGLPGDELTLVSYGPEAPPAGTVGRVLHARSVAGTVLQTLRLAGGARAGRVTVVWHVHLLRLVPFLRPAGHLVVFLHGIEVWKRLAPGVAKQLQRAALVLTNSEHTWARFLSFNPEFAGMRHLMVPLGLEAPSPGAGTVPAAAPSALMIGRAARGEGYKGHHEVIAAWARVRERVPGAELHVVGAGDQHGELREAARRHGVADAVHVHGAVTEERKLQLIGQSRCMALPSRGEGFGLAYIESMRLGRPCLVSDCDAGREVVNPPEAGLSVDPGDMGALSGALVRLLSAGAEWDRWSEQARARYEAHYTEAQFQARLRDAIRSGL